MEYSWRGVSKNLSEVPKKAISESNFQDMNDLRKVLFLTRT